MFFALKGDKFNANTFAAEALQKGASYAIIDELADATWKEQYGDKLVLVDDVLTTLQQLAGYHRSTLSCPVLAITGSNGKTTTKELVAAVMAKKFKTYATKGNLNNHIGIPLTLLAIKHDVEFAVVEMGANHQKEIESYCEYTAPNYGLITNVGLAHIEGFGGYEGVVKGKTELYRYLQQHKGNIFVSTDSEVLLNHASTPGSHNIITYGKEQAQCNGKIVHGTEFLTIETQHTTIRTNLVGEYNFDNVLAAVCIGLHFEVPLQSIKEAIEEYVPTNNRSQKVAYKGATIILDAYNANPSSMAEALKNFDKVDAETKTVIIGEMMELGPYSNDEHQKIKAAVCNMPLNKRVFVGGGFSFLQNDSNVLWFESTALAKAWFIQQDWSSQYLLIKGSRKNGLEALIQ